MSKINTPESVAHRVLRFVNEDERSLDWLSTKTRIPTEELEFVLFDTPAELTIDQLGRIAEALGRPLTDLVVAS